VDVSQATEAKDMARRRADVAAPSGNGSASCF
jgi:hypothetical protein